MEDSTNKTTKIIVTVVALLLVATAGAFAIRSRSTSVNESMKTNSSTAGMMVGGALMTPDKNIVENASNASNVTTLVTAVKAAELVETLSGTGPFTVFGPTNAAFDKLPMGTVTTLLKPESKSTLSGILTYHVVSGRYKSTDLVDGQVLTTVNGQTLKVKKANGKVMINDAVIETADVISSNGVTHVIDTVLMPKEGMMVGGALMTPSLNIVQNASNASTVTTLVAAVKAAGLAETLSGTGPFTVFGPTNAAFDKLPAGTVTDLLKPENKAKLADILKYHVVSGRYKVSDLTDGLMLKTVEGKMLTVKKVGNVIMINGATIETRDVISSNGVTHVIDTVLLP